MKEGSSVLLLNEECIYILFEMKHFHFQRTYILYRNDMHIKYENIFILELI